MKPPAPTDQRTLKRARKLRDAALRIREIMEGFDPERRIMIVHMGDFRIAYREPALLAPLGKAKRTTKPGLPYGVALAANTKLFDIQWDDKATAVTLFERGAWEEALLRLATRPNRARRAVAR